MTFFKPLSLQVVQSSNKAYDDGLTLNIAAIHC